MTRTAVEPITLSLPPRPATPRAPEVSRRRAANYSLPVFLNVGCRRFICANQAISSRSTREPRLEHLNATPNAANAKLNIDARAIRGRPESFTKGLSSNV